MLNQAILSASQAHQHNLGHTVSLRLIFNPINKDKVVKVFYSSVKLDWWVPTMVCCRWSLVRWDWHGRTAAVWRALCCLCWRRGVEAYRRVCRPRSRCNFSAIASRLPVSATNMIYDVIWYQDINMHWKAGKSQLSQPHGTKIKQVLAQLSLRNLRDVMFARYEYLPSNYTVTLKLGLGSLKIIGSGTIR